MCTIILAIPRQYELWCRSSGIEPKVLGGAGGSGLLKAWDFEHKNTSHKKRAREPSAESSDGPVRLTGESFKYRGGSKHMRTAFWLAGATALALASPAAAGDTIKIGFVSTFSGPTAVIGNDMRNSFELALDHLGRKMAGKPV